MSSAALFPFLLFQGAWLPDEDTVLCEAVLACRENNPTAKIPWAEIGLTIKTVVGPVTKHRGGTGCYHQWHNNLDPAIYKVRLSKMQPRTLRYLIEPLAVTLQLPTATNLDRMGVLTTH